MLHYGVVLVWLKNNKRCLKSLRMASLELVSCSYSIDNDCEMNEVDFVDHVVVDRVRI